MPSTLHGWTGTKIAGVAPNNPARGAPRIQALYVLMDTDTLTPRAVMEGTTLTALRTPAVSAVVADASLIVCCTSSPTPLFDGTLVPDHAVIVAMGSHEPDHRELDSALMARSQVIVEDRATALREAGDVIQPVNEGVLSADDLIDLADIVHGTIAVDTTRPRVFKCVGMSWEDLAVAVGVVDPTLVPDT